MQGQGTCFISGSPLEEARKVMGIDTREAQAGAQQGGTGPLYSRKEKGEGVGTPTAGAYDAEYDEPDHVRDLRRSVNKGEGLDLAPGAFREVPTSDVRDPMAGRVADRIGRALGKTVVHIEVAPGAGDFFDGSYLAAHPDKIFINADAHKPHLFVVGHELSHALEWDHKDAYQDLLDVAVPEMGGLDAYHQKLKALAKSQGARESVTCPEAAKGFLQATM